MPRPARRAGAARPARPTGAPPALSPGQRLLMAHPRPHLAALAAALGISREMLRRELAGARLMPVARQVALWYLLEGTR